MISKTISHLLRLRLLHDYGTEQVLNVPRQLLPAPVILPGRIQSDKDAAMQIQGNLKLSAQNT